MAGRRGRRVGVAALGALLAGVVTAGCQPPPYSWDRQLASQPSGPSTDTGNATGPVFSPDGTKVAFMTSAGDLRPTDTNGVSDTYVRDLVTGAATLVSVNALGTNGGNYGGGRPVFSPDGTKIAFSSLSGDLAIGTGPPQVENVFVRDLTTATTTLASPGVQGSEGFVGDATDPHFTPDGTKVIFTSAAANLGPVDTNNRADVYMRDLEAGTTSLLSSNAAGTDSGNGPSERPVVTPDGSAVVFTSQASDLGANDTNGESDVYLRDLDTGATTLVSTNATHTNGGNGFSGGAVVSPDARRVVFTSVATDLGPRDTNNFFDVYVRDLDAGTTTLVSADAAGTDSGDAHTAWANAPAFSPDGSLLAFESDASNLVTADDNGVSDVFVRDLDTGTTELASANAAGTNSGGGFSHAPAFSGDGSAVAFVSFAHDLGPRDTNGQRDVYIRDLAHDVTGLVSSNATDDDSADGVSNEPAFAAGGTRIAFVTTGKDLGLPESPHRSDVVVADGRQADLSVSLDAAPEPVASGAELTYDVQVTNAGPDPALDARAALVLPDGTTFLEVTASNGTCQPPPTPSEAQIVTCDFGDLGPGDELTVTVTVTVDASPGTVLTAVAATSSATGDPARAGNTARRESTVT